MPRGDPPEFQASTVDGDGQIETEVTSERGTDRASDRRIADDLRLPADLEGRHPSKVDRSKLVTEHDRILGLSGGAGRNGDLSGVPWRARRNWTHSREAASVKRLVGHDERSAKARLFVADRWIEIDASRWPSGADPSFGPRLGVPKHALDLADLGLERRILAGCGPLLALGSLTELEIETLDREIDDAVLGRCRAVLLGQLAHPPHGRFRQVVGPLRPPRHGRQYDVSNTGVNLARGSRCAAQRCPEATLASFRHFRQIALTRELVTE